MNNRTVKEKYHTPYHKLTFSYIHKVMIKYLDFEVVGKLNCFPVKVCSSPYYSPQTILDLQPLDYNKHGTISFGASVQANNENNPKIKMFCGQLTAFT